MKTKELILQSERNRKRLIEIIYKAKAGHIGGDLSCLNVLTALYFDVMNVDAGNPKDNLQDRFILSKGTLCGGFVCDAGIQRVHG